MDPQTVFCPNSDCPARGQLGKGNIGVFHKKECRYVCHQCDQTFTETKGTVFYCSLQAIVAALDLDERTVQDWQLRAGQQCEKVHQHLVQQPRDLGQVQTDEIRVKQQGQVAWLAMAVQVASRPWLGAAVSTQRDMALITALVHQIPACALCRPPPGARHGRQGH